VFDFLQQLFVVVLNGNALTTRRRRRRRRRVIREMTTNVMVGNWRCC
jgi:hypothetical protein